MTWDDDKDTFQSRPDVPDDEKITSAEWNAHTDDQKDHSDRHESGGSDELSVAGLSGVLADAQDPQTEAVQDIVGGLLAGGTNITTTYDDGNDVLTVDTSALNQEEVEDAVAALVTAGNAITVNYDDPNDALSIGVNESALSFYDGTNLTADVDNTSVTTDSLSTDALSNGRTGQTLMDQGTSWAFAVSDCVSDPSDVSSTSMTVVADLDGGTIGGQIPDGATLYGLFATEIASITNGETGDVLPRSLTLDGTAAGAQDLSELKITGIDSAGWHNTGWTEITSADPTNKEILGGWELQAEVTGGTMTFQPQRHHRLLFDWRVD